MKPRRKHHVVANLWRGWRNIETGRTPPRLGTDAVETVFRMHETVPVVLNRPQTWFAAALP